MDTFSQNLVTGAVVGSALAGAKDHKDKDSDPAPVRLSDPVLMVRRPWYRGLWQAIWKSVTRRR